MRLSLQEFICELCGRAFRLHEGEDFQHYDCDAVGT